MNTNRLKQTLKNLDSIVRQAQIETFVKTWYSKLQSILPNLAPEEVKHLLGKIILADPQASSTRGKDTPYVPFIIQLFEKGILSDDKLLPVVSILIEDYEILAKYKTLKPLSSFDSLQNLRKYLLDIAQQFIHEKPSGIRQIPQRLVTQEMCSKLLEKSHLYFNLIPLPFKSYPLCCKAIEHLGDFLHSIPEQHKTYDLCKKAIQNGASLCDVPTSLLCSELIQLARIKNLTRATEDLRIVIKQYPEFKALLTEPLPSKVNKKLNDSGRLYYRSRKLLSFNITRS